MTLRIVKVPASNIIKTNKEEIESTFSILFNVARDDIWLDKHNVDQYLFCVRRANKICDANIQYLESIGAEILRIKKKVNKKPCDMYLIPTKDLRLLTHSAQFATKDKYLYLHDCFSQVLEGQLQTEQFQFSGKFLHIKVRKQDAAFLDYFFNSDAGFNHSVTEVNDGFTINFDMLAKYRFTALTALFAGLSKGSKPVSYTNLPLTFHFDRLTDLLDPVDRQHVNMDTINKEPVIEIQLNNITGCMLASFMTLREISLIEGKHSVLLPHSTALQLIPSLEESNFEQDCRKFIAEQKIIAGKVYATGKLRCIHSGINLIVSYLGEPTQSIIETMIAPFLLSTLPLENVHDTIYACLKWLSYKECVDKFSTYFSTSFGSSKLNITSTKLPPSLTLLKLANEEVVSRDNTLCYSLPFNTILALKPDWLTILEGELRILTANEDLKNKIVAQIKAHIPQAKLMVDVANNRVNMHFPASIVLNVAPLLLALNLHPHAAIEDYSVDLDVLQRFLAADQQVTFNSIQSRMKMSKQFNIMLNLLGEHTNRLLCALQLEMGSHEPIVIDDAFFALGEQKLKTVYDQVWAKIAAEKKIVEEAEYAVQVKIAASQSRTAPAEVKAPRPRLAKIKAGSTSTLVISRLNEAKPELSKTSKSKSTATTKTAAAVAKTQKPTNEKNKSTFSATQHKSEQPAARHEEVKGSASYYDFKPEKHTASASQLEIVPELPKTIQFAENSQSDEEDNALNNSSDESIVSKIQRKP